MTATRVRSSPEPFQVVVTITSTYTYTAWAPPGASTSDSVWRVCREELDGTTVWADGDSNFDNVATDLTALSYS